MVARCLPSVLAAAAASGPAEVLVLDHGSRDGSYELAQELAHDGAVVRRVAAPTVAALRNEGARLARGAVLCFLDCDVLVRADYVAAVRDVLAQPDVAATGCRVDFPEDGSWLERTWHRLHAIGRNTEGFRAYLNSGNFAVRRTAFEAVRGFDASLITGEDAELGQRLNDAGFRIFESRRLAVLHIDNPQTLAAFFRKEIWHGLGMFGTVRLSSVDRPTVMMAVHFALLIAAIAVPVRSGWAPGSLLVAAGLAFAVPAAAAAYRMVAGRRIVSPLHALLLYQAYFVARLVAVGQIIGRALGRSRR